MNCRTWAPSPTCRMAASCSDRFPAPARMKAARTSTMLIVVTRSFVGPQIGPIRVIELPRDQLVEFLREHAQRRVSARIFLVEPPDQDHVRNGGDVPAPITALRLAPQHMIALEDRLDVLGGGCDDPLLIAVEQEIGAHLPTLLAKVRWTNPP